MFDIRCPACGISKSLDEDSYEASIGKTARCKCGHAWEVERPELDISLLAPSSPAIQEEEGKYLPRTSLLPWSDEEKDRLAQLQESRGVILTTTNSVDGFRVKEYLGIESVEYVIGTGMFSELSAGIADFLGLRSSAFEEKLKEAKRAATDALRFRAYRMGADAVIGFDLDYTEFGNNQIGLVMNGTLVRLAPRSD